MSILLIIFLLSVGCTTVRQSEPVYQKITTSDVIEGYGVIGDTQKEVLREIIAT